MHAPCSLHLQDVYQSAFIMHVIALVVCAVGGLMFVLLIAVPFHKKGLHEGRRVSEMLATLPPEVEMEGKVVAALATCGVIGTAMQILA